MPAPLLLILLFVLAIAAVAAFCIAKEEESITALCIGLAICAAFAGGTAWLTIAGSGEWQVAEVQTLPIIDAKLSDGSSYQAVHVWGNLQPLTGRTGCIAPSNFKAIVRTYSRWYGGIWWPGEGGGKFPFSVELAPPESR